MIARKEEIEAKSPTVGTWNSGSTYINTTQYIQMIFEVAIRGRRKKKKCDEAKTYPLFTTQGKTQTKHNLISFCEILLTVSQKKRIRQRLWCIESSKKIWNQYFKTIFINLWLWPNEAFFQTKNVPLWSNHSGSHPNQNPNTTHS